MPERIIVSDEGESYVFFTRRPHAEAIADAWEALAQVVRLQNVRIVGPQGVHKVQSPNELRGLEAVELQTRGNAVWMASDACTLHVRNRIEGPNPVTLATDTEGVWLTSPKQLLHAPVEVSYRDDGRLRIRFTWVGVFSDETRREGRRWLEAAKRLTAVGFGPVQGSKR